MQSRVPDPAAQARLYLDVNRPTEAIRVLAAGLAEHPDNAEYLRLLAQARLEVHPGDLGASNALPAALSAVKAQPDSSHGFRLLSICYTRLRSHDESRVAARRAREIDPELWINHTAVAHADASAKRITDDTKLSVAEALRLAPNHPEVQFAAARVADAAKRTTVARAHYAKTLELNPGHAGARNNLAIIDMKRGNTGRAAAGFVSMLAQDPTSDLALRNLHATGLATLRIVYLVIVASLIILNAASRSASAGDLRTEGIVVAAVALVAIVGYVAWIRRKAGVYFGRFVRSVPATDKTLTVWASILVLALTAIVVAIFLPHDAAAAAYAITQYALIGAVVTVISLSAARRRR